ncbi:MAG: response regulator [Chitinivibrionales bacterium]
MRKEVTVIIAEDDEGHAALIKKNLRRSGISNPIMHFRDGQETLDFLFEKRDENRQMEGTFLVLLDIRMPKVDGIEVLRRIKSDDQLKRMPVIIITTTDDPREIQKCHHIGCSNYITKPVDYEKFVEAIRRLGLFLMVVEIPGMER